MVQPDTPASDSRKPITSPFAGGMTVAQLERALERTPQMTRFNPTRRRLQALNTPDSRTSKGEIVAGEPVHSDEVATSTSTKIVQSMESLTGGDLGDEVKEISAAVRTDDIQNSISKPNDSLRPPTHEDILLLKQRGGTMPKRFLKTILKKKELSRQKRRESKIAASILAKKPSNKSPHGEKDDGHATFSSRESGSGAEVDTPVMMPEPPSDENSGNSQESVSLEEIIRTAPRCSSLQALNDCGAQNINLSFGPSRLIRKADIDTDNENDDNDDDLGNLDIAILELADSHGSSTSMLDPDDSDEDSGTKNKPQIDHPNSQKPMKKKKKEKKEKGKKRPRRLPLNELHLVSERVERMSQVESDENIQASAELPDDPISQDTSDALQVLESIGRTKREEKTLKPWSNGYFGRIEQKAYRFPSPHKVSPQAEADNPLEVSPSYSDGFVGSEANPTGRCMPVPKQKRVSVGIWGLTTRVGQLDLVREKEYGLIGEPKTQAKRRSTEKKAERPTDKETVLSAPLLVEIESQPTESSEAQHIGQDDQNQQNEQEEDDQQMRLSDDEITLHTKPNSMPSQLNHGVVLSLTDSQTFGECFKGMQRRNSSESQIYREMEMVLLKRRYREDSEQDGSSVDESEASIVSISSDDDETEESDHTSDSNSEEMNEDQERWGDFDVQPILEKQMDSRSDIVSISADQELSEEDRDNSDEEIDGQDESEDKSDGERRGFSDIQVALEEQVDGQVDAIEVAIEENPRKISEQSSEIDDIREDVHDSREELVLDKQVSSVENIARISLEQSNRRKERPAEPFEDLVMEDPQMIDAMEESFVSQLSIAIGWKKTMTIPEADTWRPRKPRSSSVMNETAEEIIDSPSPVLTIAQRRRSTGLQLGRRRTFSSRPLALTTSRPRTPPSPEILETQFIPARGVSPELGGSQVSDMSNKFENSELNALPPGENEELLPHSSQLSFVPEEVPEESYFFRASQSLMESFQTPKSRAISTPSRFHSEYFPDIAAPTFVQPSTEATSNLASGTRVSPRFSQLSYAPTPRCEKSLSSITRKASFALGTLPASVRRNRAKTLAFVPPFKKPRLGI